MSEPSPTSAGLKGLPGRTLAILYVATALAPLIVAAMVGIAPADGWTEAGSALGMVACAIMAAQFATSGRFRVLSGRIGIDRTMAFHKWASTLLLAAAVLHPLLYAAPILIANPERGLTYLTVLFQSPRNATGLVGLIALALLVVSAHLRNRLPLPYEAWRATHVILAVVATLAVIDHALRVGTYSAAPLLDMVWVAVACVAIGSLVVVYLWRSWRNRQRRWTLVSNTNIGRGLWELAFRPDGHSGLRFRAGQFVWLVTAPRLLPLFDHPFSIASTPRAEELRLIIKEVGDYTQDIGALQPGTRAGIDGPHGAFTLDHHAGDAVLLIAGGAGIAPVLGILRDLDATGDQRPIRVLIGAGTPEQIAGRQEIEKLSERLDIQAIFVAETPNQDWIGPSGRLTRDQLARMLDGLDPATTIAMICGPGAMMVWTADTLLDLGIDAHRIVYERFDYADTAMSRIDRAERTRYRLIGAAIIAAVGVFALRAL